MKLVTSEFWYVSLHLCPSEILGHLKTELDHGLFGVIYLANHCDEVSPSLLPVVTPQLLVFYMTFSDVSHNPPS